MTQARGKSQLRSRDAGKPASSRSLIWSTVQRYICEK